jgi:hypothetical protein
VVGACQKVGFRSPLDVRWCRLSHFLAARSSRLNSRRGAQVFELEKYAITFVLEKVADYLLGQCRRCGTMFWEEG